MSLFWTSVILGLLEGITEFLPVSSTGHLILAEQWLGRQSDFFIVVIQSGTVLAVTILFREKIKQLLRGRGDAASRQFCLKLAAAFGLTVAGVLLVKKGGAKLPETAGPIAWATLIGGVLFIVVESVVRKRTQKEEISWLTAVVMGMAQVVAAIFPGTSRSGATILAALLCGATRPSAAEFSFLLGIPTLLAAAAYETLKAVKQHQIDSSAWLYTGVGFVVAAVTAFVVVKWLLGYIQHHSFVVFGWYRIILGALILFLL